MARRKLKTALQRYMDMDGPEPMAVMRGLLNRALEGGDYVAAERIAAEMAPYKHARLSAVASQIEMFGADADGVPVRPQLDEAGRVRMTFSWKNDRFEEASVIDAAPAAAVAGPRTVADIERDFLRLEEELKARASGHDHEGASHGT